MTSISAHLWFDHQAADAVAFYTSIFGDSEVYSDVTFHDSGPNHDQDVHIIDFRIGDMRLSAFNGGPHSEFNEAISLAVVCDDQDEVDRYWKALTADGGREVMCGWLRDRFGVSWQIIPSGLNDLLADPDPARARKAMVAMLAMKRIVLADIEAAMDQPDQTPPD